MKKTIFSSVVLLGFSFALIQSKDIKINSLKHIKLKSAFYNYHNFQNISLEDSIKSKTNLFKNQNKTINGNKIYIMSSMCGYKDCLAPLAPGNEPNYDILLSINKITKNANYIMVGYNFLADSETYSMNRTYVNDSTIKLEEVVMIGGEEDSTGNIETEDIISRTHFLTISSNGQIKVVTKNAP